MLSVNHSFTAFHFRVKASKASSMLPSTERFSFLKDLELFPEEREKKLRRNCDFQTNPEAVPCTHTAVADVTCSMNASQTPAVCGE